MIESVSKHVITQIKHLNFRKLNPEILALCSNSCDNYHIDIINHKIHTFKTYIFFKVLISETDEKL